MEPIYHWNFGDIALAKICRDFFSRVKVTKNEEGLFYDKKGLNWFDKRKIVEHNISSKRFKSHNMIQDSNTSNIQSKKKLRKQSKSAEEFNEYLRCGKELFFDEYFEILKKDADRIDELDYVLNVNASTEDKFQMTIKHYVSEKEIEHYLRQCWKYTFVDKKLDTSDNSVTAKNQRIEKFLLTAHTPWCIACGGKDDVWMCTKCPSSFHINCDEKWKHAMRNRKFRPKMVQKMEEDEENTTVCPSCTHGPKICYDDIVWHKLRNNTWWPARVLLPGQTPSCLLSRTHSPQQWPLRYYGNLDCTWGDSKCMCLFLPKHTQAMQTKDEILKKALQDASIDFVVVYRS